MQTTHGRQPAAHTKSSLPHLPSKHPNTSSAGGPRGTRDRYPDDLTTSTPAHCLPKKRSVGAEAQENVKPACCLVACKNKNRTRSSRTSTNALQLRVTPASLGPPQNPTQKCRLDRMDRSSESHAMLPETPCPPPTQQHPSPTTRPQTHGNAAFTTRPNVEHTTCNTGQGLHAHAAARHAISLLALATAQAMPQTTLHGKQASADDREGNGAQAAALNTDEPGMPYPVLSVHSTMAKLKAAVRPTHPVRTQSRKERVTRTAAAAS